MTQRKTVANSQEAVADGGVPAQAPLVSNDQSAPPPQTQTWSSRWLGVTSKADISGASEASLPTYGLEPEEQIERIFTK
jgi:hypothetical protein